MKNRINNLIFFFLRTIVVFLFFSCGKEEIHPITTTDRDSLRTSINEVADDTLKQQLLKLNSLADILASVDFDEHPQWGVAIKAYNCRGRGKTLVAYNLYEQDIDFYDSDKFLVLWFKDGKPVRGTYYLNCVCNGAYAAIAINRVTKQGIGIAFHSVRGVCHTSEFSTTTATK